MASLFTMQLLKVRGATEGQSISVSGSFVIDGVSKQPLYCSKATFWSGSACCKLYLTYWQGSSVKSIYDYIINCPKPFLTTDVTHWYFRQGVNYSIWVSYTFLSCQHLWPYFETVFAENIRPPSSLTSLVNISVTRSLMIYTYIFTFLRTRRFDFKKKLAAHHTFFFW